MKEGNIRDQYSIQKDLIYTQYFKRAQLIVPDRKLVSIARYQPIDFKGQFMRELAPPNDVFKAYKNKDINEKIFTELYYDRVLSKQDHKKLYEMLKGKVLCCWEPPNKFCHRHIITEWFNIVKGLGYTGGEL